MGEHGRNGKPEQRGPCQFLSRKKQSVVIAFTSHTQCHREQFGTYTSVGLSLKCSDIYFTWVLVFTGLHSGRSVPI